MKETILYPGLNLGPHHDEAHQDAETPVFGFWVFLMSDLITFGLMFALYVSMANPMGLAGGPGPKQAFDLASVFSQTLILLTSSLTFGVASLAMRHKREPRQLMTWLAITLALGLGFLALELRDFFSMIAAGATPSRSGFLSGFWGLVPLHGLHVAAGCVWIAVMMAQIRLFGPIPPVQIRLLRLGLFWHFLDLIWVGIFSIVYLPGLAT